MKNSYQITDSNRVEFKEQGYTIIDDFLPQELHDELGQSLTAIKVITVAISRAESENVIIKQSTDSIIQISDHLMRVVRSMMQQLHPLILTELGLKAALDDLI